MQSTKKEIWWPTLYKMKALTFEVVAIRIVQIFHQIFNKSFQIKLNLINFFIVMCKMSKKTRLGIVVRWLSLFHKRSKRKRWHHQLVSQCNFLLVEKTNVFLIKRSIVKANKIFPMKIQTQSLMMATHMRSGLESIGVYVFEMTYFRKDLLAMKDFFFDR